MNAHQRRQQRRAANRPTMRSIRAAMKALDKLPRPAAALVIDRRYYDMLKRDFGVDVAGGDQVVAVSQHGIPVIRSQFPLGKDDKNYDIIAWPIRSTWLAPSCRYFEMPRSWPYSFDGGNIPWTERSNMTLSGRETVGLLVRLERVVAEASQASTTSADLVLLVDSAYYDGIKEVCGIEPSDPAMMKLIGLPLVRAAASLGKDEDGMDIVAQVVEQVAEPS